MAATEGVGATQGYVLSARRGTLRGAAVASIGLALALGVFLLVRRLSGALQSPLAPLSLAWTALLLLAWALAVQALAGRLAAWGATFALLLFAAACSYPGERAADWLVWLGVIAVLVASYRRGRIAAEMPRRPTPNGERVLQQLTRFRSPDGSETIRGTLVAELVPGERVTTVYVAFCPPFERLPQVDVESAADVEIVERLHHGVRLEVRLPRPAATPTAAAVEVFATDAGSV